MNRNEDSGMQDRSLFYPEPYKAPFFKSKDYTLYYVLQYLWIILFAYLSERGM